MYYSSKKPRYSPIGPIDILAQLQDKELLGNYLLLLAPEILRDPRSYIDLIDEIRATDHGDEIFIVVDNGLIEQGEPISTAQVIEAAAYIDATCIQMPDVLGERMSTQRKVMESAGELRNCGFPLMKIPQGDDSGEQVKCVEWLRDYIIPSSEFDYWGIPRWIANTSGSRIPIIQYINASTENPSIHLLGMSNHIDDDLRCCLLPNVMGIDSANPLVLGYKGMELSSIIRSYIHVSRGEYMESTLLNDRMIRNVEYMHGLVSGFPSQAD